MDEFNNQELRPPVRRRRRKSKLQIFKETTLPMIIIALAVILILTFVIGAAQRASKRRAEEKADAQASQEANDSQQKALAEEAKQLRSQARVLADGYDYNSAIAIIDSFSGDISKFPELLADRAEYTEAQSHMVAWSDPSKVTNLSFHLLIADPQRAFRDSVYGSSYKQNFITVNEFKNMLQELYDKGYMLVRLSDVVEISTNAEGKTVYKAKVLYLPEGKKPLILTQTNVNYYTYMTDSNGDGVADKGADGFASRLILDNNGNLTNEYVDAEGNTMNGAYDMVPILNAFVEEHPDFSYVGARAILAVTGYDGIFGYRIDHDSKSDMTAAEYNAEVQAAKKVVNALREQGYELACYSYINDEYGSMSTTELQADLKSWTEEIAPVIGNVDILVYVRESDIGSEGYTGGKYNILSTAGFRFYIGYCENAKSWATVNNDYVRMGRIIVSGSSMQKHPEWFANFFDVAKIADAQRNPQ